MPKLQLERSYDVLLLENGEDALLLEFFVKKAWVDHFYFSAKPVIQFIDSEDYFRMDRED